MLNIEQMKSALTYAFIADIPVMLWGPPGIGKTQGLYQWAADNDYVVIDIRLSQIEPVDMRGIPYRCPDTNRTMWAIPSMWPDPDDHDTKYVIFFDEINHGDKSTMSASFQAIQERALGEYKFPKGCRFAAAGNRAKDRGIANLMPVPLRNRFLHLEIYSAMADFVGHALRTKFHELVIGFARFSPDSINELIEHNNTEEEHKRAAEARTHNAISTPRTMEMVSKILYSATDAQTGKIDFDGIKPLILGAIGEEVAVKFNGYAQFYKDLPDMDKLIKNPSNFDIPDNPGMLHAISIGLAARVNAKNAENVVKYVLRMPQEFQAYCMKDAVSRDMSLIATQAFADWSDDNANVLF